MRKSFAVLYGIFICAIGLSVKAADLGNLLAVTTEVAFSSLDEFGNYSQNEATRISGAAAWPQGYEAYACQFVPVIGGTVSSIELGLAYSPWGSSDSQVDVRLSLATGGLPLSTPLLAEGTLNTSTLFGFGGLTSFVPANPVQIETDQAYWLTVTPHSDTTASDWCNPSSDFNLLEVNGYTSRYGPEGLAWYMGTGLLPAGTKAFRVNVVPEPSVFALAGCGVAGALLLAKRSGIRFTT